MNAEMFIQIVDSFAQQGYLNFRRACVAPVNSVTLNQVAFGFARQRHPLFSSLFISLFNRFRLTRSRSFGKRKSNGVAPPFKAARAGPAARGTGATCVATRE
jgi:hypothetical protein